MPSQFELFQQMEKLLDLLIDNANELNRLAKLRVAEQSLEPLQQRQYEILHELSLLDAETRKSDLGVAAAEVEKRRTAVREKLVQFQNINREFITRIADRFRIIDKKEFKSEGFND